MDSAEPDTPFAAVTAQTSKISRVSLDSTTMVTARTYPGLQWIARGRANDKDTARLTCCKQMYQSYLDKATPYVTYRWVGTATVFVMFALRIIFAQGWYIGTPPYY